jgi:hypothetical protein
MGTGEEVMVCMLTVRILGRNGRCGSCASTADEGPLSALSTFRSIPSVKRLYIL